MVRAAPSTEDLAPVPTEAPTQAVPTQEVCVPTQEVLADPPPRTLEDWVNVAAQAKRSRCKSVPPVPGKSAAKAPPTSHSRKHSALRKTSAEEAADVPTQKLTEELCPPTQKLAELAEDLCPTQKLPEESPVLEPSEPRAEPPLEPTVDVLEPAEQAYGRRASKRRKLAKGPTDTSGHRDRGEAPGPASGSTAPAPEGPAGPARAGRLSFQDLVSFGRRLRGKQALTEAPEAEASSWVAAQAEEAAPGGAEPACADADKDTLEDAVPWEAVVTEERPMDSEEDPSKLRAASRADAAARLGAELCRASEGTGPARAHEEVLEPASGSKTAEQDGVEALPPAADLDLDLRSLVKKHILELREATRRMQTRHQKVLEVYQALEASL